MAIKVGTPVAQRPPRRSLRAIFPHRTPQINAQSGGSALLCLVTSFFYIYSGSLPLDKTHFSLTLRRTHPLFHQLGKRDLPVALPVLQELRPGVVFTLTATGWAICRSMR